MNNYVGLKFGNIKCWNFEKEFCDNNRKLIDELNEIDERMSKDCVDMFSKSNKNKDNVDIKIELVKVLEKLFDLNVEIYNAFDNKTYKTKKSFSNYILNYNKGV